MANTNALHSYTTTLSLDPAGGSNYATVAEVIEISDSPISVTNTKCTSLNSPNRAQEFKPGMIDYGSLKCRLNATKAQLNTLITNLGVQLMSWKVTWPLFGTEVNGSTYAGAGHIDGLGGKYPDDDRITFDLSIKASGKWTFTQGS
jgi:hypothetical protein